jgi:pimeloyl-ACP methyl ester carboxylesterase
MSEISFAATGTGRPLILIHGFPMNHLVWTDFAAGLSEKFTVYTPDLPGFGQSKSLSLPFSLDDVATQMLGWIRAENIQHPVVIGHSLGGYVTLAMAARQPELFAGIGLFHSTAYADSAEKKESRTKSVEFIQKNGAAAFTSNFIEPLFATKGHPGIARVREIAVQSKQDTVIGYTQAMRDRPDRTDVIRKFPNPILFLAGEKDQAIPAASVQEQAKLCHAAEIHLLKDVAHMGMLEQPGETIARISSFVERC